MISSCVTTGGVLLPLVLATLVGGSPPAFALPSSSLLLQRPGPSEKESRTAAQRKIDSQLLYELYRSRGEATRRNVPPGPTGVKIDRHRRALVDLRADVTPALQKKVQSLGGTIESVSREYRSIVAWVPFRTLERLAGDPAVHAIVPAAQPTIK